MKICETIMIVDGSLTIRNIIKKLFEKEYEVVEVKSGDLCLEHLKTNTPDLIILDILMPGLNGIEVLKQIREKKKYKNIAVIMLTGEQTIEDKVKAFKAGANDYVEKSSLNTFELRARVKNFLKVSRLFRSLKDEIGRRKRVENELLQEKAALEEINIELALAKREIEHNALEAGRIQAGAMVYHHIGNTITPLSVGLSRIDMDVYYRIPAQLKMVFENLSRHSGNLTQYVNEDPKGQRIFNHIQDIFEAIDDHASKLSKKIEKTQRPITIVAWTNEEGTRFAPAMMCSGVWANALDINWIYDRTDINGLRFEDELMRIGYKGKTA